MKKRCRTTIHLPVSRKLSTLFFLVGCLLMTTHTAGAQRIDVSSMVERRQVSCSDIALSMTRLIPEYHRDNQNDTLTAMLIYWQENCGGPEPMVRFHILYQIQQNTFSDDWYPDNMLDLLVDYQEVVESHQDQPYYYDYFLGDYVPVDPGFSEFTTDLASYLQRFEDLRPIETFFLTFYARQFDKAMEILASEKLKGTRLHTMKQEELERIRNRRHRNMGIYAGLWRPSGNLAILGNKAQIGFFMGSVRNRLMTNFHFSFGFINTPEEYFVVHDNTLYGTNSFFGVHMGFDVGRELVKTPESALIPFIGVGAEGFEAFSTYDQENYGLSKVVGSLNLNIGMEYRIITNHKNYVGLQARYHVVNYQNRGGSDLSGNVATFGITLGFGH